MNVVDKRISHFENNLEVNKRVHNTPISRIRNKLQILCVCTGRQSSQQCGCGMT